MLKSFCTLLPACCLLSAAIHAAPAENAYQACSFQVSETFTLPYRLLTPDTTKADTKYPLIVFLHGAGERGTDNKAQLIHVLPKFAETDIRQKFPCFVAAPQCPANQQWVNTPWSNLTHDMPPVPTQALDAVDKLIDALIKERPIDTKRIYVIGLSMGGYGTWDLIMRFPKRFAAAVPICGGADIKKAHLIKSMPIWFFHGDSDTTVPTFRSRSMCEAFFALGVTPKYTEFPNCGHNAWTPAMNTPELLPWLFSQKMP